MLRFGDIVVARTPRQVSREGRLHLTPIEYHLLQELCGAPGRVLTYQHLLKAVWGADPVEDLHHERVHMATLRKKTEADPDRPRWLITEVGVGYRPNPKA